jgi:hypothetical protein
MSLPRIAAFGLVAAVAVAACSGAVSSPGGGSTPPTEAPVSTPPASEAPATMAPGSEPPASEAPPAATFDQPWATAALTDVATGETFRVADLAATQVVVIEPMAIWCSKCREQQRVAHEALKGVDGVAYVVLTVDPSEDAAALARYREDNGFAGLYAVAGPDVSRALAGEFGDLVLNPPSTPMIVTSPDGRVTLAEFGHKSAETIAALVEEHRGQG